MSEWISVNDRLPELQTYVLVVVDLGNNDLVVTIGSRSGNTGEFRHNYRVMGSTVTHWMPLPEPPR